MYLWFIPLDFMSYKLKSWSLNRYQNSVYIAASQAWRAIQEAAITPLLLWWLTLFHHPIQHQRSLHLILVRNETNLRYRKGKRRAIIGLEIVEEKIQRLWSSMDMWIDNTILHPWIYPWYQNIRIFGVFFFLSWIWTDTLNTHGYSGI
jgi:hypothetical protein